MKQTNKTDFYVIACNCDNYNAQVKMPRGAKVIGQNGTTATWIYEDLLLNLEDAKKRLEDIASSSFEYKDNVRWEEDEGRLGYYHLDGGRCLYAPGDMSFTDDVVSYEVVKVDFEL